jgi:hypothetical protein
MRFYWTGEWLSFGGLAGSSPKQGRPDIRREAIRILGGPIASLLMAIPGAAQGYQMAIFRPFFHNPMPHPDQSLLTTLSMLWGFISATVLIGSLLPFRNGPLRSDGSTLWILQSSGKAAARYAAMISIATDLRLGGTAAGWPANWMEDATALPDGRTDDAFGCYYAYFWFISRREYGSAGKAIVRALAAENSLPTDYRAQAHLEAAYYYVHVDGNLDQARLHFEKGKSSPLATHARIRAIQMEIESA